VSVSVSVSVSVWFASDMYVFLCVYIYCIYLYINGAGVGVVEAAPVMREELMHAIDRIKELFFLFLCDALVWTDSGHLDISTRSSEQHRPAALVFSRCCNGSSSSGRDSSSIDDHAYLYTHTLPPPHSLSFRR